MTANPFAPLLDGVKKDALAKIIYEAMRFERKHETPEWVESGNATAQEEARRAAINVQDTVLAALAAAVPADLAEAGKVVESLAVFRTVWGELPSIAPHSETAPGITTGTVIGACGDAVDLIAALIALATAQAAQIEGLQRTYEELYADALADAKSDAQEFDSDLWKMVRAYLDELHFDWRDFMEDGVTADEAMTHIRECMNEEARRAEAAETALAAEWAKVAKLVEALNTIDALDPEGRIGDCSVNAISGLVLRMGEIARAAITEAGK